MWWKQLLVVSVFATAACGGEDKKDSDSNTGTGGLPGAPATGGTTGTGGAMGTGGAAIPMCPAEPGPPTCGSQTCPAVPANLSMACVKTCCTADSKCGTHNWFADMSASMCMPPFENTTMCPNEMIMGNMVPGCCVTGTNECGIIDILTGMGCIPRTSPVLIVFVPGGLMPANCDGTMPMGGAGTTAGTGGMGTGGMGTGGMGTGGMGTGGMGTGGMGTGGMGTGGMN